MSDPHAQAVSHTPDEHTAHHVDKHVRTYLIVGGLLFLFTAITVGLSYVDFGTIKANIVIALIVATFKAGLVAAIFMHLNAEKWTIYRVLIFTCIFALGLFVLTWLAYIDPIIVHHVP